MKILLTGATGLLGSALLYQWRSTEEVVACVHQKRLRSGGFVTRPIDIRDASAVQRLFSDTRPDWVCHAAAATDVDDCESRPELCEELNVRATGVIAEAAHKYGARLLFISTDSVFDGTKQLYTETDEPRPLNRYAESKLRGEQVVSRLPASPLIVRTNIFGWNLQRKTSLAEWVLASIKDGRRVPGWTDVYFSPIFTVDLAEILLAMMRLRLVGTYHASGSERCSKYEFARRLAEAWDLDADLVYETTSASTPLKAVRPKDTSLDVRYLSRHLNRPIPGFRAGLFRMRQWAVTEYEKFSSLLV